MGTSPVANLVKGLIFGVALSLVVIPGAELFTDNNFVMGAGLLKKKVSVGQAFSLWAVWSGFQTQNDAAKLIMVFWCLLAFPYWIGAKATEKK